MLELATRVIGVIISLAAISLALLARPDGRLDLIVLSGAFIAVAGGMVGGPHPLGPLAPSRVFLWGGTLYIIPPALTVWLTGTLSDIRLADQPILADGAVLSLIAFATAAIGIGVGGLLSKPVAPLARPSRPLGVSMVVTWIPALALFGVGASAVGWFVFGIAGLGNLTSANYGERYQMMAGYGVILLGVQSVIVAVLVLYASGLEAGRGFLAGLAVLAGMGFLGFWTGVVGSRSAFIQLVIGFLAIRQMLGKKIPSWKLASVAVVLLLAGLVVGVARAGIRHLRDIDVGRSLFLLNPANSEFGATLATIGDVSSAVPSQDSYRGGTTYLEAFAVVVPRKIWPNRPPGAGEWYVERFYPEVAEAGGAYAFSPVAEAYLNFGVTGIVVIFLCLGLIVSRLDRGVVRMAGNSTAAAFYGIGVFWLLMFSRLDSATLLKTVFVLTFGQMLVVWLIGRLIGMAVTQRSTLSAEQVSN
ncbi:MAG: O-antigen polymerase [Gemmatimonadales bacterium]